MRGKVNATTSNHARFRIGLQGSVGVKRSPDPSLHSRKSLQEELRKVQQTYNKLADKKERAIDHEGYPVEQQVLHAWERLVGQCRVLTISFSASGVKDTGLASEIYETGVSCSLLGGNLSYYLSCLVSLLDLPRPDTDKKHDQYCEHLANFILYFGCFSNRTFEICSKMRSFRAEDISHDRIRDAMQIFSMYQNHDYVGFERLYQQVDWKQKTILSPARAAFRKETRSILIKAYLSLPKAKASSWLTFRTSIEAEKYILNDHPELKRSNDPALKILYFRCKR